MTADSSISVREEWIFPLHYPRMLALLAHINIYLLLKGYGPWVALTTLTNIFLKPTKILVFKCKPVC